MKTKYSDKELNKAIEMIVEQGKSYQDVVNECPHLNKSIVAREMRKYKNRKCEKGLAIYRESREQEDLYNNMICVDKVKKVKKVKKVNK